jgi:hypothetical protein
MSTLIESVSVLEGVCIGIAVESDLGKVWQTRRCEP